MSTPFPQLLENAKLRFAVRSLSPIPDTLGNPRTDKEFEEYICFLKHDSQAQRFLDTQGVGQSRLMAVRGYLIRPMHLSDRCRSQMECTVEVQDSRMGVIRGSMKLSTRLTPTQLVESITGDRLIGVITVQGY